MIASIHDIDILDKLKQYPILKKKPKAKKHSAAFRNIIDVVTAFDIETTTIHLPLVAGQKQNSHAFMYVWQFQLDDVTIMGRTWEECFLLFKSLADACLTIQREQGLATIPLLIIWVHNLAYEFTFLSGIYPFVNDECFFRDVRKPIYCRMYECLEFRCSYIQTNMSLSHLTKQMKVEEKLSGQKYNYNKIRYPSTPLSEYEQAYCARDVQSLVECMRVKMRNDGDTLQTIPLTSTGYVRRDCIAAITPLYMNIKDILPSEPEYRLLRKAFRGGNTHASRKSSGKILRNVYSYDMSSCYPAQQLTKKFPMSPWKFINDRNVYNRVEMMIGLGYAVVGLYQFRKLRLKRRVTIPYLSLARTQSYGFMLDNGRILEADYCEVALTEVDMQIVLNQYTFDAVQIDSAMVAQKHYLPDEYREVIKRYYRNKTMLKGTTDPEELYQYAKSKEKLNGIYGMSAQDPIHADIRYEDGLYIRSDYDSIEVEKVLKSAKFPYSWGVYTTAYARAALQEAIDLANQNMVYCDTDSVKVSGKLDLSSLNKKRQKLAEDQGAYADDPKGKRHYMGVFELDGVYDRFVTCGAKRYAYEANGHLSITVSGVSKAVNEETGVPFAVEELKCLENFKEGFIWSKAAGTMAVYNDDDNFDLVDEETGDIIHIGKNVALIPTTYEMTYAQDYKRLLKDIDLYGDYMKARE